jgi:hypothetical protein
MKFSRLLREGKLFWPHKIYVGDGELQEEDGVYFPTLSDAWNKAEELENNLNEWHELMSWAIFCGAHKLACEALKLGGVEYIYIKDIDHNYVQTQFSESLLGIHSGWTKQTRTQYVNDYNS